MGAMALPTAGGATPDASPWPLSLVFGQIACMLNFELADHPVYDGAELQWFDDDIHGTGMLAFLSRRGDRTVDYYQQPQLALDRAGYHIGGGTRSWQDCDFDVARLSVDRDGVDAEVRFCDTDGRLVEIRVDDCDGHQRRRAGLLAPVSAGIERPTSLLLVWLPAFDLVRATRTPPLIRIDGSDVTTGHLLGRRLHRRHLIKYAAPVLTVELNRVHSGGVPVEGAGERRETGPDGQLTALVAEHGNHGARLVLEPGLPPMRVRTAQTPERGRWHVEVDGTRLTGGSWAVTRTGQPVHLALDADEPWRPGPLPWLMRVVTTVVPVFRRWPTTYRWRCDVRTDGSSPRMVAQWHQTGSRAAESYRRATAT